MTGVFSKFQSHFQGNRHCLLLFSCQSCPILCHLRNCNPPSSSVLEISQARILEWVAISPSRGYSWPRDWTHVSCISCLAGRVFTTETPGKPYKHDVQMKYLLLHCFHFSCQNTSPVCCYIISLSLQLAQHVFWVPSTACIIYFPVSFPSLSTGF